MVVLFRLGFLIFVAGGLGTLLAAFQTHLLWGLACLFISPACLVFLFCHWSRAKGPFSVQVVGGAMMPAAAYMGG